MVALYCLHGLGTGLNDIRINGALCQELDAFQLTGLFLKYADKLCTDDLSLLLRIRNACQLVQETIHSIYINQVCPQLIPEYLNYLLRLTFTKQTMIYMNTG